MLKASRLVPGGTSDSVNAGGLEEQRATPVHEKLSDIAIATEHVTSTAMIAVRTAVTVATWRYALNETSHLPRLNKPPTADVGVQVNELMVRLLGRTCRTLYVLGKAVLDLYETLGFRPRAFWLPRVPATNLATSRAHPMKRSASGLSVRFFTVMTPTALC